MSDATVAKPDLKRLQIDRSTPHARRRGSGGWVVVLLVLGCAGAAAWHFRDRLLPREAPAAKPARVAVVREVAANAFGGSGAAANGYVVARRKAALSTVLSGRLVDLNVEEGTHVEAGQVVARIQYDDYESAVRESERALDVANSEIATARSQVDMAEAQIDETRTAVTVAEKVAEEMRVDAENLEREMERQRASREAAGDMSESEWDKMKSLASMARTRYVTANARAEAARAGVRSAEASRNRWKSDLARLEAASKRAAATVESAKLMLEKTYVRAPFAGTIVRKEADVGEVVSAIGAGNSRGSVATLVDMATLEVQVEMTEKSLGVITSGHPAVIVLDAQPARQWPGHVRQVWPTADRQKGTIELRVVFDRRPEELRPEMGARVEFQDEAASRPAASEAPVLVVAAGAVRDPGGKPFVFEISNGTVHRRSVELGGRRGPDYVVVSGISRGAKVVVDGAAGLVDGAPWVDTEEQK